MSHLKSEPPMPSEGEVIATSAAKSLLAALLCFALFPAGALLAWAWWTDFTFGGPLGQHHFTAKAGILGILAWLVGFGSTLAFLLLAWNKPRLVLAPEHFQYIAGERKVLAQVPYANVARIEQVEDPEGGKFIGIEVRELAHPDLWCPDAADNMRSTGWHYRIMNVAWTLPFDEIHQRLRRHIHARVETM